MNADRLFFPAVLAACAALTLLSAAEPARIAQVQASSAVAAAAPVVQLERVVITAPREQAPRQLARADAVGGETTTVVR